MLFLLGDCILHIFDFSACKKKKQAWALSGTTGMRENIYFLIYGLTVPLMVVLWFEKNSGFYQNEFSFFFF